MGCASSRCRHPSTNLMRGAPKVRGATPSKKPKMKRTECSMCAKMTRTKFACGYIDCPYTCCSLRCIKEHVTEFNHTQPTYGGAASPSTTLYYRCKCDPEYCRTIIPANCHYCGAINRLRNSKAISIQQGSHNYTLYLGHRVDYKSSDQSSDQPGDRLDNQSSWDRGYQKFVFICLPCFEEVKRITTSDLLLQYRHPDPTHPLVSRHVSILPQLTVDRLVDEIFDAMNEGRLVDSCNLLFHQDRFTIFNQIVVDDTYAQLEKYTTDLYYKSLDCVSQTFHRRRKLMLEHTRLPTDLVKMIEDYLDLASSILPRLPKAYTSAQVQT